METWIDDGIKKDLNYQLELIFRNNDKGEEVLVAAGYEFEREQCGFLEDEEIKWIERVLVIKSPVLASKPNQRAGKTSLNSDSENQNTYPRKRSRITLVTDEEQLLNAIEKILKEHRVTGLLDL